jgi:hypothetical protein
MEEIVNGKHVAIAHKEKSFRDWVLRISAEKFQKNLIQYPFTGKIAEKKTVNARVDFGRWMTSCPDCNGCEYVDPDDPFLFCLSCGNVMLEGFARKVIFPKNMAEIEKELLKRPVDDRIGSNVCDRAMKSKPVYRGLSRSWNPGETITDLKRQLAFSKEAK